MSPASPAAEGDAPVPGELSLRTGASHQHAALWRTVLGLKEKTPEPEKAFLM